jgi:hypothetical protein
MNLNLKSRRNKAKPLFAILVIGILTLSPSCAPKMTPLSPMGIPATMAAAPTYLYATFTDDTGPGMKLKIYTSTDAVNWTLFSDTGFPDSGASPYLRDASIMKWKDGILKIGSPAIRLVRLLRQV